MFVEEIREQTLPALNFAKSRHFNAVKIFEGIAFYGILIFILLAAIPYGTVNPWVRSLFVFLVCIIAVFRVVAVILTRKFVATDKLLFAPLIGILGLAIIQVIPFHELTGFFGNSSYLRNQISMDPYETKNFIFTFISLLVAGEILLRYTDSERRLLHLIYLVLFVGVGSALFGFARQIFFNGENNILTPFVNQNIQYAQFVNRNHFAYLMEMTLGILLGLLLKAKLTGLLKILCLIMTAIVCVSLISANSRGGLLSVLGICLFAVSVYFFTGNETASVNKNGSAQNAWFKRYLKRVLATLVVSCLLFAMAVFIVAFIGGDTVVSRIETIPNEVYVNEDKKIRRLEIWQSTINLIQENPVAGVGFGAYPVAITFYDKSTGKYSLQQAHNDYLEVMANGGVIAFVLTLLFLAILFKRIRRQFKTDNFFRQASCFGASLGICGVMLHSMVDFGLHVIINALVFVILIVIATAKFETFKET